MGKQDKMYRLEIVKTCIFVFQLLFLAVSLIIARDEAMLSREIRASDLAFGNLELEREINSIRSNRDLKLEEYTQKGVPKGILTEDYLEYLYPLILEYINKAELIVGSTFNNNGKLTISGSQYLRPYLQIVCVGADYIDSVNTRIQNHIKEVPKSEEGLTTLIIDSDFSPISDVIEKNKDLEIFCNELNF